LNYNPISTTGSSAASTAQSASVEDLAKAKRASKANKAAYTAIHDNLTSMSKDPGAGG
jgi:hypothetical protein